MQLVYEKISSSKRRAALTANQFADPAALQGFFMLGPHAAGYARRVWAEKDMALGEEEQGRAA